MTSYIDVLVAENELFAAELASVRISAERQAQVINVYRAMGGGWVTTATTQANNAPAKAAASGG
jgi:multidrug efflux system outer membrane protein